MGVDQIKFRVGVKKKAGVGFKVKDTKLWVRVRVRVRFRIKVRARARIGVRDIRTLGSRRN